MHARVGRPCNARMIYLWESSVAPGSNVAMSEAHLSHVLCAPPPPHASRSEEQQESALCNARLPEQPRKKALREVLAMPLAVLRPQALQDAAKRSLLPPDGP